MNAAIDVDAFEVRPYRTQTYGGLHVESFLRDVGVRQVSRRPDSEWVSFRCPFHDDRKPSAAMHAVRTTWRCHACGCGGNAATFLAMLKGVTTTQAHHRILESSYHEDVVEPPSSYQRRTDRATTGTIEDLRSQLEHAIELLERGARYNRVVDALVALYGVSKRTAKYRIRAAKIYLGQSAGSLGKREALALPMKLQRFNEDGGVRVVPVQRTFREAEEPVALGRRVKPPVPGKGGGYTKTRNSAPSDSRGSVKLTWMGPSWVRPRRAGVYYELADGRWVHETHSPRVEVDWLATGATAEAAA